MSARDSRAAAPRSTVKRAPAIFAPRSKSRMPRAGPRSQCACGAKSNFARRSPGALDAIRRLVAAARHRRVRDVRHAPLHCREETVGLLGALLERVDLLLERLHLHERLGRRLALDGRELVAPPPLLLELRHGFAPLAIEPRVVLEPGARVAFGHLGEKSLRVLAQELAW